jgi:uncharacterized delta-60 repeat protein
MARLGRVGGLALVILALVAVPATAREGALDPAFGTSGYALTSPDLNIIGQLAAAPDGDIFVVGTYAVGQMGFWGANGKLFRIAPDGRSVSLLDSMPNAFANDVAVQPDGKVVVAGGFIGPDSDDAGYDIVHLGIEVWRYLPNGSPDTDFGDAGKTVIPLRDGPHTFAGLGDRGLDLTSDGHILVAGGNFVARLGPSGSVEQSYTGPKNWDIVAIGADENGGAVIGGAWLSNPGIDDGRTDDWLLRRLTASLEPDPTFTPPVIGPGSYYPEREGYASDLSVQPDGRVVVVATGEGPHVVRLTTTGALDPSFSFEQPPTAGSTFPDALAIDSENRILLTSQGLLERLNPDGSPDSSFGTGGLTTGWPPQNAISWVHNDVAVQPDGGVVVTFAGPDADLCCPDSAPAFSAGVARFIRQDEPAAEVRCGGRKATVVGSAGPDTLKGTKRRDVIAGLGGNDRILGLARADIVCGEAGNDTLRGGSGRDRLFGGPGKDLLDGGKGRDLLRGGSGANRLRF